jgi:hypothetical protein
MSQTSRRQFIKLSGLAIGGLFLQIPFSILSRSGEGLPVFPREIGAAYKRSTGQDAGVAALRQHIMGMESRKAAQIYVNKLIDDDYANGRCFNFEGWQLSHTEGRLCAMAA